MRPAGEKELAALLRDIQQEFPRFRIVPKHGDRLSRLIDLALKLVTFGAQHQYMTHYHTVIGDTLYVPSGWQDATPVRKMVLLRHERVHLRQRRRKGDVVMTLQYLFPIAPMGAAWGRARIEWEAYEETIRATAELCGLQEAQSQALRHHIVRQFTSGAYGWMWPFPRSVNKWYDRALRAIVQEAEARAKEPQE
jgi:hypothetical protein